jgi:hypothetical protein
VDNKIVYFHGIANVRKIRNTIILVSDNGNVIEGDNSLLDHATKYYKILFGPSAENTFPLDHGTWEAHENVDELEKLKLS